MKNLINFGTVLFKNESVDELRRVTATLPCRRGRISKIEITANENAEMRNCVSQRL